MGTSREDQYTFIIISRSVLRVRIVSDKHYRENKKNMFYVQQIFFKNLPLIM